MRASDVPESMFKAFGGKNRLDIKFVNPKKVLVQKEGYDDDTIERVTSITVMEFEGLVSIDINYLSEKGNQCSSSTGIQNYKGIEVLD
jgi:hypothetical protein